MNRHLLMAAAVTALFIAQTAWAQPATVTVTLVGRDIQVSPDPVVVEARMGRGVAIRWQIAPNSDAVFDPTGIRIDGERVGGTLRKQQDQIGFCGGGPKNVVCRNENSKRGEFKYTVRLLDSNRNPIEKDPIIVNR